MKVSSMTLDSIIVSDGIGHDLGCKTVVMPLLPTAIIGNGSAMVCRLGGQSVINAGGWFIFARAFGFPGQCQDMVLSLAMFFNIIYKFFY